MTLFWMSPPVSHNTAMNGNIKGMDTINLKCLLYSPKLFYACELGEKPVSNLVDSLVGEIKNYDSSRRLNLVIVTLKDLGFGGWKGIPCAAILDSARSHGYKLCPPQTGPELIVLSQTCRRRHSRIPGGLAAGKPIYIGMKKLRHYISGSKSISPNGLGGGVFFDYIFCIKGGRRGGDCQLGFCATDNVTHIFSWTDEDRFILVQPEPGPDEKKSVNRREPDSR